VRVAVVSPYSLSVPGGVQGQVLGLAWALARRGHRCLVVGPADGSIGGGAEAVGGGERAPEVVAVGRSMPVPANGSVARLSISPLAAARTVHALSRFVPDVVHLHEPLAPGPTWAALLRPGGAKVGTFHRAGTVTGASVLAPAARALASRLTERTAVSDAAAGTARALVGGRYRVIGNGVELERFAPAPGEPGDTGATTHPGIPTVLFVGRHEQRKGLAVLLEAFGTLDPARRVRLWVAGDGPQTAQLRARFDADDRVEWLGRLDDDELAERLRAADVLCAPALHGESFGIVLVEAMAARAVVVASDIPGYSAVVGRHGVLVPPGDARALAGALSSVLGDAAGASGCASPAALDAASAHARQWSMAAVADRYLEVYEEALRQRREEPAGS
jgi:phosphatidylinositol alpha-mannosyltransferase